MDGSVAAPRYGWGEEEAGGCQYVRAGDERGIQGPYGELEHHRIQFLFLLFFCLGARVEAVLAQLAWPVVNPEAGGRLLGEVGGPGGEGFLDVSGHEGIVTAAFQGGRRCGQQQ